MPYGVIKVDQVTFTNAGVDQTISVSGIVASISGNITATGTISGDVIRGGTTVSGATVTGTAGRFGTVTGNTAGFTTVTGTTVTGATASFTSGVFTSISGGTHTITSGVFASGTAAAPSITFAGDLDTGVYASATNQVSITTSGTERLRIDATGQIEAASLGTAAAPAYSFTADPDTGVYSPGTNQLAVSTAGTGRLFVDANGNVGVGTGGTQSSKFHVEGTSRFVGAPSAIFNGTTGTYSTWLYNETSVGDIGTSNQVFSGGANTDFAITSRGATALVFGTNATERMRIDSSGRLLVGTSSARSNIAGVSPGIQLEGANNNTPRSFGQIYGKSDAAGPLFLLAKHRSDSVGGQTVVSSGDELGQIVFTGSDGSNFVQGASIKAEVDGTPGANDMPGRLVFSTTADGASSPTERMRLDSSGRLLVGTSTSTSVGALVQVRTGAANNHIEAIRSSDDAGGPAIWLTKSRGTAGSPTEVSNGDQLGFIVFRGHDGADYREAAYIYAEADGTWTDGGDTTDNPSRLVFSTTADGASSPTARVRIDSSGRLGIGTASPAATLDIFGNQLFSASNPQIQFNAGGPIIRLPSANTLAFLTDSTTERMRLDSAGRLGIGTSSPTALLHVNGDAQVNSLNGGPLAGFRNRIINGDMRIDQRNAGAAVTLNNAAGYPVDRWQTSAAGGLGTGIATVQRVVDGPAGFPFSIRWTTTNAKTTAAGDSFYVYQPIEGLDVNDLALGSASAKALTLSFWVKSSLTGTFAGHCRQMSGVAPPAFRSYIFAYTISSANTWEFKTVSIAADTTAGFTTNTNNQQGLSVLFDLGSGSSLETTVNAWQNGDFYRTSGAVRVIGTLNATWQVTGVQLEPGPVATPFEQRPIGTELALCQRYYEKSYSQSVVPGTITNVGAWHGVSINGAEFYSYGQVLFRITKRIPPTVTVYSPITGNPGVLGNYSVNTDQGNAGVYNIGDSAFRINCNNNAMSINNAFGLHWVSSAEL